VNEAAADADTADGPGTVPEAAEAIAWIELLAEEVGPRRPTSPLESLAARLAVGSLRKQGVPARLETFGAYSSFAHPFGVILATAAAPALVPRTAHRTRTALAALAAAALLGEGSLKRSPLSDLLARGRSQNVVATIEPAGDVRRTLCLSAHIDTSRSGLIFDPRFVGMLQAWIAATSALVVSLAALEPIAGSVSGFRRWLDRSRGCLFASLALLAEREVRGVDVPGANDNASGCAVVACLAAELARDPLATTRVVVLITGGEEAGTLGARAFLDAHDTKGWLFLNFDSVGGDGTLRFLRREGVITHWTADPGLIRVAERLAERRQELVMAAEDRPAGLTYDSSPVLARGGRALTLSIQDGSIPHLHQTSDTVGNVSATGVARALEAGRELVTAIDSGSAG